LPQKLLFFEPSNNSSAAIKCLLYPESGHQLSSVRCPLSALVTHNLQIARQFR